MLSVCVLENLVMNLIRLTSASSLCFPWEWSWASVSPSHLMCVQEKLNTTIHFDRVMKNLNAHSLFKVRVDAWSRIHRSMFCVFAEDESSSSPNSYNIYQKMTQPPSWFMVIANNFLMTFQVSVRPAFTFSTTTPGGKRLPLCRDIRTLSGSACCFDPMSGHISLFQKPREGIPPLQVVMDKQRWKIFLG